MLFFTRTANLFLVNVAPTMTANVLQLGEVADFEALTFFLELNFL
jgi:hypothetical protein